jgi:hypothetical protein
MANAISVAVTMPTISVRGVASIAVTVEDVDLASYDDLIVRLSMAAQGNLIGGRSLEDALR